MNKFYKGTLTLYASPESTLQSECPFVGAEGAPQSECPFGEGEDFFGASLLQRRVELSFGG